MRHGSAFVWLETGALAWGALAFGAVYPWAYVPLFATLFGLGCWGLLAPGTSLRRVNGALAVGLALLATAVGCQLVPLPRAVLLTMSPATDAVLRGYDLVYATSIVAGPTVVHALSIQPGQTWVALLCLLSLAVCLLGMPRAIDAPALRALCLGVAILGVVIAMVGIIQRPLFNGRIYGFWTPAAGPVAFGPAGGPFGPFVNRNHFAGWMLMALPLTIGYFCGGVASGLRGVRPAWRPRVAWLSTRRASGVVFAGVASLVMAMSLVLTLSRSGITSLVTALALSALVVRRRGGGRPSRLSSALVSAYLLLLVLVAIGWVGLDVVAARFGQLGSDADGRLLAWRDARGVVEAFPWTGTGLATYSSAMLFFQTHRTATVHFGHAHNDYLQLVAEGGALLVVPSLVLLVLFVREVRRRFRAGLDHSQDHWIRCGAVTGLIAIALQELVEFSLQMPGNAALFAVLCGIAVREAGGGTPLEWRSSAPEG